MVGQWPLTSPAEVRPLHPVPIQVKDSFVPSAGSLPGTCNIEESSSGRTLVSETKNGGSNPSSSAYDRKTERIGSCLQSSLSWVRFPLRSQLSCCSQNTTKATTESRDGWRQLGLNPSPSSRMIVRLDYSPLDNILDV